MSQQDVEKRLGAALDRPSAARVYDYMLGGSHNYAIDRTFADAQAGELPDMRDAMRANRQFIGRAVRAALDAGVRQFVDIGSGLPSQGQAHQVADEYAPDVAARVVYVDNEDIAHAHSEILIHGEADPSRHHALFGDYFGRDELWADILATGMIREDEPTCLIVAAVLHFMPPESAPGDVLAYYRSRLVPGSFLVISHGCDELDDQGFQNVISNYRQSSNQALLRSRQEIEEFFGDWQLLDPGVSWVSEWRPEDGHSPFRAEPQRSRIAAGVARKPSS